MTLQNFAYLGNPIVEQIEGSSTRAVYDRNGNEIATLKATAYGRYSYIDYAEVLRTLFENTTTALAGGCLYTVKDYNLHVEATIGSDLYWFTRGVSHRRTYPEAFKFLTNMPSLRHYVGYPLSLSYIIFNDSRTYWSLTINEEQFEDNSALMAMASTTKAHATSLLNINPNTTTKVTAIYANGTRLPYLGVKRVAPQVSLYIWGRKGIDEYLTDTSSPVVGGMAVHDVRPRESFPITQIDTISTNKPMDGTLRLMNDGNVQDSIVVREAETPVHPFYVRWVNDLGGWDYFMFACQQKYTKTLTKNDTYESGYIDASRYGMRSTYHKAATKAVEVSTGVIDRQTYESVAECVYSPLVQWYDEEVGVWVEIQPRTDKQEIMADQPTGELVMTFDLPTPQMNK